MYIVLFALIHLNFAGLFYNNQTSYVVVKVLDSLTCLVYKLYINLSGIIENDYKLSLFLFHKPPYPTWNYTNSAAKL